MLTKDGDSKAEIKEIVFLSRWYFGGTSSAGAAMITHPLDIIKVHMQTEHKAGQPNPTVYRTFRRILATDSVFGLYSGLTASLLRQLTYSTTRFGVYETLKQKMSPDGSPLPFTTSAAAAALSGAAGGLVGSPADMINVRMQNDVKLPRPERRNYKHAIDGLFKVYKFEGAGALFNGASMATSRAILMTVGQLAVYDQFKLSLMLMLPLVFTGGDGTCMMASFGAGAAATGLTQPFDVLKTRFMNSKDKRSIASCIRDLYKEAGLFGFFKGYIPAFIRLAPHTILTFFFLEKLRLNFGIKVEKKIRNSDHS